MTRNIKALGLTALAALAMAAVSASAAQAVPDGVFTAGKTPNTHTASVITVSQEGFAEQNFFETDIQGTNCTKTGVSFGANDADGTATELAVFATYSECLTGGLLPFTVHMNGCHYNLNQPTSVEGTNHKTWKGTVDIACPKNELIEIREFAFGGTGHDGHAFLTCATTVLPQNNLGHVTYHNREGVEEASRDWLTLDITLSGITYVEHGFFCANETTETTSNGSYKITVTLRADNPNTPAADDHDLWISTHAE
jgi:hypothetical protein